MVMTHRNSNKRQRINNPCSFHNGHHDWRDCIYNQHGPNYNPNVRKPNGSNANNGGQFAHNNNSNHNNGQGGRFQNNSSGRGGYSGPTHHQHHNQNPAVPSVGQSANMPLPPPSASVMPPPNDNSFNQIYANAQGRVSQNYFNAHFGQQNSGTSQCDVYGTVCQLESKLDPKCNDNAFQWNGQAESKLDPTNNA